MIENLFSVVLFFSIGYIARKKNILEENASDVLIKFIVYFAFPALVVYNVYHLKVEKSILYIVTSGWLITIFLIFFSFLVGKRLNFDNKKLASFIMMSTFGNTSFLGFPFQLAFNGEEGLRYAVVYDQLASFLSVSLLSPFILAYGHGKKKISIDLKSIFTFPPFITLILSFFLKPFVNLPDFILSSLNTLGMTVIPLALFSVGFNLKFSSVKERIRDISVVLFIKMLVAPFLLILALLILNVKISMEWKSTVLEVAMPPMVLASIFVINEKLDRDLAVSSVGLGIILSFVTVPIIMFIIK